MRQAVSQGVTGRSPPSGPTSPLCAEAARAVFLTSDLLVLNLAATIENKSQ